MSGAKSVVRVRKVRHEGDENSLDATVARIEDALNGGRLADVIAEIDKLPPESRERISDWRDKVAARLSVDQAIAATESELKAALVTSAGAAEPAIAPASPAPPAPPAGGAAPSPPAPPAGGATPTPPAPPAGGAAPTPPAPPAGGANPTPPAPPAGGAAGE